MFANVRLSHLRDLQYLQDPEMAMWPRLRGAFLFRIKSISFINKNGFVIILVCVVT